MGKILRDFAPDVAQPMAARASRGRMRRVGSVMMIVLAMSLAGCGGRRGGAVPYGGKDFGTPDNPGPVSTIQEYHIGPSDVLAVSVFGVAEFSGDYTVDNLGRIKMPLVGDVPVMGQTADGVATSVTGKLKATYLRNPQVQVLVKSAQSQRVTVDGSVTAPGIYPVGPDMTLLQMVAQAKGLSEDANPRRVVIFRQIKGQRNAAAFDLTDIRRGKETDPIVYGNDVIMVDGNGVKKGVKTLFQTLPLISIFHPF